MQPLQVSIVLCCGHVVNRMNYPYGIEEAMERMQRMEKVATFCKECNKLKTVKDIAMFV